MALSYSGFPSSVTPLDSVSYEKYLYNIGPLIQYVFGVHPLNSLFIYFLF
jgi:hypothetical protein